MQRRLKEWFLNCRSPRCFVRWKKLVTQRFLLLLLLSKCGPVRKKVKGIYVEGKGRIFHCCFPFQKPGMLWRLAQGKHETGLSQRSL